MVSTYSTPFGFEKPGLNDYFNTWHTPANNNYDLIAAAIGGATDLELTEDTTLTNLDGAADQSRAAILNITSSDQHDRVITVPAEGRLYVVRNASAYRVKIKPAAGTATDIMPGTIADVMVSTTHCYRRSVSGWGLFSNTATASGASVTITLTTLSQHFNDLMLVFKGVDATAGTMRLAVRTDAAGSSGTVNISSGGVLIGDAFILGYRNDYGGLYTGQSASGASPLLQTANEFQFNWRVTGGIGSIVASISAGAFAGGSIDCYLR
jgi:hypothetical protein